MKPSFSQSVRIIIFFLILILASCNRQPPADISGGRDEAWSPMDTSQLIIIWTTAEKEVAMKTVLIYALNARLNGWIKDLTLMVWGPSVKLLANDKEVQDLVVSLCHTGVKLQIDKSSAEDFGVAQSFGGLNAEVRNLGKPLTRYIQQHRAILTF